MRSTNLTAFLSMIGWSEGTTTTVGSDDGYNVLVGGTLFKGYRDHPNVLVHLNARLESTAAGRYQILYRFWKVYRVQLGLMDFGHLSQDAVAVQLIRECRALEDIETGRIAIAIGKCSSRWASLPGAGYGQHEHSLEAELQAYKRAGGTLNTTTGV